MTFAVGVVLIVLSPDIKKWKRGIEMKGFEKRFKLICVCVSALLLCAGCSPSAESVAGLETLDTKLVLDADYDTFLHYADGNDALLSLEKNIDVNVGPATATKGFVKYGLKDGTVEQIIPADTDAQINSAMPFGDALLYVDYTTAKDKLKWNVFLHKNGERNVLRSGVCNFYSQLPEIALIDGAAAILWEDTSKDVFKLELYDGQNFSKIELPKNLKLTSTELRSNTKELAFLAEDNAGKGQFILAGKDGVMDTVPLDGKAVSFGLTKDCLVCSLGDDEETSATSLIIYNFRSKEQQEIKTNREFYRMADSQTDEALCVDYEFKILKIDSSKGEITEIQAPEGYAGEPVVFGIVSEKGCLAGFLNDEQYEYCFMNELD